MRSIKTPIENTLEIKRSTFVCFLFPVRSIEDIDAHLKALRQQHSDASHHCVAYILGEHQAVQKFDDDGEPSQTAGLPMLEVLKKQELTDVLSVVIRYYGGVKLGAGGLIRAYAKSVSEAIKLVTFTEKQTRMRVAIKASYETGGKLEGYLRDKFTLIESKYDDAITFIIDIDALDIERCQTMIQDASSGQATINVLDSYSLYV